MGEPHLPPAPSRGGLYTPVIRDGRYLYVSGHPPVEANGEFVTGVCSTPADVAAAKIAAAKTALAILATVEAQLGSVNHIKRLLKSLGMVNCVPGFEDHPVVIDGCKEPNFTVVDLLAPISTSNQHNYYLE